MDDVMPKPFARRVALIAFNEPPRIYDITVHCRAGADSDEEMERLRAEVLDAIRRVEAWHVSRGDGRASTVYR